MPKFDIVPKEEALHKARFSGKNAQTLAMYSFFLEQLNEGKAGRLKPGENETIQAVRRRLGEAVKLSEKSFTIKRVQDELFFWISPDKLENKDQPRKMSEAKNPGVASWDEATPVDNVVAIREA